LVAILTDEGYDVDTAETAQKAIEKSERKSYHMALIDVRLPDMDGTELLTKFKPTIPKMRKIIITGYPTLQNAMQAVNKRADAYIMKPFDVKNILKAMKEQLDLREEEKKYSQDKVAAFIETRVRELDVAKASCSSEERNQ